MDDAHTPKPAISDLAIDRTDRERRSSWRVLLPAAIVVLAAIVVGGIALAHRSGVPTVRTSTVGAPADPGTRTVLNASGYVTPRRRATVAAKITGRVTDVLIDEGMVVTRGQVLATLDDSDARKRLAATRADRDVARAGLDEVEVNLADARRTLRRVQDLRSDGVSSQQDVDSATTAVAALEARLVVARRNLEAAEAQLAVAQHDLENYVIRSPFAGVVVSKDAQPGEMVSPISAGGGYTRTGIATIVDMSSLEIEVDVNESYIARVHPGQEADAVLDAYPDWHIPATVRTVIPTADRQKATVKVRLTFDHLDPRLLPDMGIKVAFREGRSESAEGHAARAVVAAAAVRGSGSDTVVFVLDGDHVERRAVTLGPEEGDEVQVVAGLTPGERVVVDGPPELEDGQAVRVAQ